MTQTTARPRRTDSEHIPSRRPARANLAWTFAAIVTLLAACLPAVLWPGDISWMNDEPNLIAHALHANERHVLADEGLLGSFGIKYGPLPTQVYQAMLLLTHDPVKLVAIHALLCSAATALALLWLARTLRLTPWFAAAVLLAPYLWLYQRTLWDATFTIPLGDSRWRRTRRSSVPARAGRSCWRSGASSRRPSSTRRRCRCSRRSSGISGGSVDLRSGVTGSGSRWSSRSSLR